GCEGGSTASSVGGADVRALRCLAARDRADWHNARDVNLRDGQFDEYLAVMDLPAEFYLQTVRTVFQEHARPLGKFEWQGRRVDPRAIRRTALFTVEGERDDICAVGQTLAAQGLYSSLRPYMKRHHVQTGVGHYGVFNGQRWRNSIYPILTNV